VPNPFGFIWASTIGTSPIPPTGIPGTFELFSKGGAPDPTSCPAPGGSPLPGTAVTHGFLTDWVDAAMTSNAQADAAAFLVNNALPPSVRVLP
jgi:hypothetical protein